MSGRDRITQHMRAAFPCGDGECDEGGPCGHHYRVSLICDLLMDEAAAKMRARCVQECASKATIEALAFIEHERWASWMRYQDIAPPEKRAEWPRKVDTPYWSLTDQEQESDRVEARRSASCVASALRALPLRAELEAPGPAEQLPGQHPESGDRHQP